MELDILSVGQPLTGTRDKMKHLVKTGVTGHASNIGQLSTDNTNIPWTYINRIKCKCMNKPKLVHVYLMNAMLFNIKSEVKMFVYLHVHEFRKSKRKKVVGLRACTLYLFRLKLDQHLGQPPE